MGISIARMRHERTSINREAPMSSAGLDAVSAAALAAGGTEVDGAEDYGFMYSRSFTDLDGHGWQVMWMDPVAAEQGPEAFLAAQEGADVPA